MIIFHPTTRLFPNALDLRPHATFPSLFNDLEELTNKAFPQKRLIDNAPMPITRQQLRDLYERALTYW